MTDLLQKLIARQSGKFPDYLGLEWTLAEPGHLIGRLDIKPHHIAPNGFLHAAVVVGLADTACGYGCYITLPEGASGFTTVELKTNFLRTLREGAIVGESRLIHGGRSTQVWDATVTRESDGEKMALFRCTQIILYPRA
ncbi:MAG: PaaI family thioesterase [Methylocystis sp.]|nr:PaaI family thioesterase [Methylocystis sp.]